MNNIKKYLFVTLALVFVSCNNKAKVEDIQVKETPIKAITGELKNIDGADNKYIRLCISAKDENLGDVLVYKVVGEAKIENNSFIINNLYTPEYKYLKRITEQFPVRIGEILSDTNVMVTEPVSELVIVNNPDANDYNASVKVRLADADPMKFMPGDYYTLFIYVDKDVIYKGRNFVKSLDPVGKEVIFVFEYDFKFKQGWNKIIAFYTSLKDEKDLTGETDKMVRTSRFKLFSGDLSGQRWYIYRTNIFKDE
jgi:hypothetical protein